MQSLSKRVQGWSLNVRVAAFGSESDELVLARHGDARQEGLARIELRAGQDRESRMACSSSLTQRVVSIHSNCCTRHLTAVLLFASAIKQQAIT